MLWRGNKKGRRVGSRRPRSDVLDVLLRRSLPEPSGGTLGRGIHCKTIGIAFRRRWLPAITKLVLNADARYSGGEAGCVLCVHRAVHDKSPWLLLLARRCAAP